MGGTMIALRASSAKDAGCQVPDAGCRIRDLAPMPAKPILSSIEHPMSGIRHPASSRFGRTVAILSAGTVLLLIFCLCGCTHEAKPVVVQTTIVHHSVFPPRQVMESGDYAGFLAENEKALKDCNESEQCATILFNLGFVHAYSRSPYVDKTKALSYFNRLIKSYPGTPLAFQSQAWVDLIDRSVSLGKAKQHLQGEIKAKDAAIEEKDAAIEELRDQIQRSRDIDVEMDRKERELLH